LAISLAGALGASAFSGERTMAQITPDATLGAESSTVRVVNGATFTFDVIEGGATRGTNLFHSFEQFSVPTGRVATFNYAADIQNIISRVTGTSLSNLEGFILANGTANLFLLNPNGIIIGPDAQLAIGGSFVASTAESAVFNNGFAFSATNPQAPPLLTINVPMGLQYGANPGRIVNQSVAGFRAEPGKTLALIGGDVDIEGGVLYTPDGRIELGSVAGNSFVGLTPTDTGYALNYEGVENFQDINLSRGAFVNTSGEGGGSIQVQGRNVTLSDNTVMSAVTLGNQNGGGVSIKAKQLTLASGSLVGAGGSLLVNATEGVQVIGTSFDGQFRSGLIVETVGTGEGGDLTINTPRLLVSEGALISASTYSSGAGGSLSINATEGVQVIGTSFDGQFRSGLGVETYGTGEGGDLTINTPQLLVSDGALISASTYSSGAGGSLSINATEEVQVIGTSADSQVRSGLAVETYGTGEGGDLTINTPQLLVSDGALISASTFEEGAGGRLSINTTEGVQVIGTSADSQFRSGLGVETSGAGEGGDLTINTPQLFVSGGAVISASTSGEGAGGSLSINATEGVQVIGTSADGQFRSGLGVETYGTGAGGDLTINTPQLLVSDGAGVSASTSGEGTGGSLSINASEGVQVMGTSADSQVRSSLTVETLGAGAGGDLTINTSQLLVSDGAVISASTSGEGVGGSLSINATEGVQVIGTSADGQQRSSLTVETSEAEGGGLTIDTSELLVSDGAVISASTYSSGAGGSLSIRASEGVQVIGTSADGQRSSALTVETYGAGEGGDLTIDTEQLLVSDGAIVSAATYDEGAGGSLSVKASKGVEVIGTSADGQQRSSLTVETLGAGEGGDLTINTSQLLVSDGGFVSAGTYGEGAGGSLLVNASEGVQVIETTPDVQFPSGLFVGTAGIGEGGNLTINTAHLLVSDGGAVSASTYGEGTGGSLFINASEGVQVIGTAANGQGSSGLFVETEGIGEAGDLIINTRQLLISDGALVSAGTRGSGAGGSLLVNASERVQVIGTAFNGQFVSGLSVETLGTGNGGDLTINTPHLLVSDGAGVSARTFSSGTGGDLSIKANESVQLESGFISVQAISGGTAGNLTIETQQMSVSEGSEVAVSSPGGQAGNLTITANSLILNQGTLTAETGTSGAEGGANITLNGLELLLMGNESLIDANALGKANGGNITIDSQFIVATSPVGSQGSDIVANAVEGNGGRVNITTQGIFGIKYQASRTPENDITASSDYGVAGEVTISQPDVDPSRGLAELPTDLVDAEGQIDRRCTAGGKEPERNRFTVTGRGGLPPNPNETLQNQTVVTNWIEFDDKEPLESRERTEVETNANLSRVTQKAIVEAQGWVISTNGQVTLTANASTPTPHSSGLLPASCEDNQAAAH